MSKFKLAFFTVIAAATLLSVSSTTANGQEWHINDTGTPRRYTNNPCADPRISWVLWMEANPTGGTNRPRGGVDCNNTNYGDWTTIHAPSDLQDRLKTYRYQQKMNENGITVAGTFRGKNGDTYFVFNKGSAMVGMDVGRTAQVISNSSSTLVSNSGGTVVAQGAGNFVSLKDIVDQGGAKILGNSSSGVVAQGAGNVVAQGAGNAQRRVLAVGDTLFQFPNRYAVVSGRK